ncbi:hypothetical protein CPAV1605_1168 [seawater metagenome]|uniref:Uncharacterized protein n=1 Tax=seawater metagenome TaxID=1561972 RepID=A0A5E8CK38_9ZZZZ
MSTFTNVIGSTVDSLVLAEEQPQENPSDSSIKRKISIGTMIGFLIYLALVLFVGKGLWDKVLCQAIPACKPMPSLLHFLGLVLLLDILLPNGR